MPTQIDTRKLTKQTAAIVGPAEGAIAGGVNIEQIALIRYPKRGLTFEKFINSSDLDVVDLIPRAKQIDIYYSVFDAAIHCEIQMLDSVDELQNPETLILGEEYVAIQYRTPTSDESVRLLFRIYSIGDLVTLDNNKSRTYTLYAASPEAMDNAALSVFRRLKTNAGEDGSRISDIVSTIVKTDLKSEKPVRIEPSSGLVNKYLLNMYPLEAIDYLRQIAVSSTRPSSAFVFYESPTEYVFATLEQLFADGLDNENVPSYLFDTIRHTDHDLPINNRALAYNQVVYVDNYTKLVSGGLSNVVLNLDLITGNFTNTKYNHLEKQGSFQFSEKAEQGYRNTEEFVREYVDDIPLSKMIVSSATDTTTNLALKLANQQAYALELAQNVMQLYVYGNSDVRIGDVIRLDVVAPDGTPPTEDEEQPIRRSELVSARHLITKLRDTIKISDNPQHMQSFELVKGHFLGAG